jgi:hypothetical protein
MFSDEQEKRINQKLSSLMAASKKHKAEIPYKVKFQQRYQKLSVLSP